MLKAGTLSNIIFITLLVFCACIDPYFQKLRNYESLLVIDGLITDENSSYAVRLSRTMVEQDANPYMVSNATVFITDNTGSTSYLNNTGNGLYKTDSNLFRGQAGRVYTLHIETGEGDRYVSDQCPMPDGPEIDSAYFEKDQELVNNGTESNSGIRIYLDSEAGDIDTYYRWEYEDTWIFKVPFPKKADYIDSNTIIPVADPKEFCWKSGRSDEILIHSAFTNESEHIQRQPILFIASDKSDRLLIQYSILIKQYSISKAEFDFWDNLKRVSESGSDIFASQPYTVISNIHNLNRPDDRVLGYFRVSSVKQKRLNISVNEIAKLDLPFYHYRCEKVETWPADPIWVMHDPPLTFDQLYERYINSGYTFIEPKYFHGTTELDKIIFVLNPQCANCELTGTPAKPDFWKDLN